MSQVWIFVYISTNLVQFLSSSSFSNFLAVWTSRRRLQDLKDSRCQFQIIPISALDSPNDRQEVGSVMLQVNKIPKSQIRLACRRRRLLKSLTGECVTERWNEVMPVRRADIRLKALEITKELNTAAVEFKVCVNAPLQDFSPSVSSQTSERSFWFCWKVHSLWDGKMELERPAGNSLSCLLYLFKELNLKMWLAYKIFNDAL